MDSMHVRRFVKWSVGLSVDAVCCVHCCVGGIRRTCCCVVLLCVALMTAKTGGCTIENESLFFFVFVMNNALARLHDGGCAEILSIFFGFRTNAAQLW